MTNRKRVYLGIDPGQKGGIAIIHADGTAQAWRYPGDIPEAAALLNRIVGAWGMVVVRACIEKVSAMPRQGVSSTFKFGANFGAWQGMMSALCIPYVTVTPQQWQKTLLDSGTGETKERSLNMARRMFPDVDLSRKADDGKADALHLARWAIRQHGREGMLTAQEWIEIKEKVGA